MTSQGWILASDWACGAGILAGLVSGCAHLLASRAGRPPGNVFAWLARLAMFAAAGLMAAAVWRRWVEVNHFPSQTMSEVLTMFSFALLLSLVALHYALGLHRRSAGWAILDDVLVVLVLAAVFRVHMYTRTLPTAQRDLPPALQSYWFPPHLSALIFSYATLSIAALICLVYFAARFWGGVFAGGRKRGSQVLLAVVFLLLPFFHVVAAPVLLLTGLVFLTLRLLGRLPSAARLAAMERDLDEVSFRAFAVGFPFLTAGLWMGAFWAQEAWANYWGWDSKENSALITWLVYVMYIHLRMLGGYRGEKAMAVLLAGALSIFATFQLFGYLPDSQKSMHRYTDDNVVPREGMQGPPAAASASAAEDVPGGAARGSGR